MKKTYKKLRTKDDDLLINHAKRVLAGDFHQVWNEAGAVYRSIENQSAAKRAANAVILNALKEIGEHPWRKPKEQASKPATKQIVPGGLPPSKQGRKKWTGASILDMLDEKRKRA